MKRLLLIYLKCLIKALLFVVGVAGGCVWMVSESAKHQSYSAPAPAAVSNISNAELQGIIADVYHVETSRFIQPDILWITAPSSPDLQRTCEGIANLWAARSGLNYVCVESWSGGTRLARAKVQNGSFIEP